MHFIIERVITLVTKNWRYDVVLKTKTKMKLNIEAKTKTKTEINSSTKITLHHIGCCLRAFEFCVLDTVPLWNSVRRRSRRTFSTHFEIFRRRVDGVVIYFFNSDFKFFEDASEFSFCPSMLFLFSLKSSC